MSEADVDDERCGMTLAQVELAQRFAYQLTGGDEVPIYNPYTNELAEIIPWEGIEEYGSHSYRGRSDSLDGWYHLPGCDCRFCAEMAIPDPHGAVANPEADARDDDDEDTRSLIKRAEDMIAYMEARRAMWQGRS